MSVVLGNSADGDVRLRVLTFNLWGIFNSKIRVERMRHFATKVGNYDIILLQEQFLEEDFNFIISELPEEIRSTRYFKRFPSSFYGSGCAIISRYPIESSFFHTFPLQGYPEMVLHGDFFANKGAALAKIMVPLPSGGCIPVKLYTTHLVAVYTKVSLLQDWRSERYLPYRISQAVSLAEFVAATSSPGDPIIIGGDFNSSPASLEVQIMCIMLKQRGYNIRPALPRPLPIPPGPQHAALPSSRSAQAIDWPEAVPNSLSRSHAYYTYADSNAYNTMTTSYFKLLKLQGDLPVQIDHIFYDSTHFTLESFEDCPDYEAPTIVGKSSSVLSPHLSPSHPSSPSAVVVLTKDEVEWPTESQPRSEPGLVSRAMDLVARLSGGVLFGGRLTRRQSHEVERFDLAEDMEGDTNDNRQLFPLSDHYGVATRLRLSVRATAPTSTIARDHHLSSNVLTEEERQVIEHVREVLSMTAQRLRVQQYNSRIVGALCGGAVVVGLFQLARDRKRHRRLVGVALGLMSKAVTFFNESEEARHNKDSLRSLLHKTAKAIGSQTKNLIKGGARAAPVAVAPRYLVSELELGEVAESFVPPSSFIHIVCLMTAPFLGLASIATGMLHRLGNAKLFEDQLHTIEKVCYPLMHSENPQCVSR